MGLRRFFLKFLLQTISSLIITFLIWLMLLGAALFSGMVLPANEVERRVTSWQKQLDTSTVISPADIPAGADYAFFSTDGTLTSTTLSDKKLDTASNIAASTTINATMTGLNRIYSRVITDSQIIVITYQIQADFSNPTLRRLLPDFELIMLVVLLLLIIFDFILMCFHYAKKLEKELLPLQNAAEQIREHNLDFELSHTKLKEFDRVLCSLDSLRLNLKESLHSQWILEQQKKNQMTALAHDIKTPLTILRGNAELLLETDLSEEQKEYACFITENTAQITRYVTEIIEVSKNQDFIKSESDSNLCELPALLAKIKHGCLPLTLEKNLDIRFQIRTIPDIIPIPADTLKRILYNLLDNAIQYSPVGGKIILTAELFSDNRGSSELIFQVMDEGSGFSKKDLKLATTEFYRADDSRGNKEHFGMGLFITSQMIAVLGGTLLLSNRKTGGACVKLTLPCSDNLSESDNFSGSGTI